MTVGRGRRGRRSNILALQPLLLFSQEVYNELLVIFDEVIREALVLQVLTEMLSPERVESIKKREFRRRLGAIQACRGVARMKVHRLCACTRGLRRGGRWRRGVSMGEETSQ